MESINRMKLLLKGMVFLQFLVVSGFANQVQAAGADQKLIAITGLKVETDGKAVRVGVLADGPLVYSYYKVADPPKAVIDFAQTEPAAGVEPKEVSSGTLRKINVLKNVLKAGTLTRLEFELMKDTDFRVMADSGDKSRITAVFGVAEPSSKPADSPTAAAVPAPSPVAPAASAGKSAGELKSAGDQAAKKTSAEATEVTKPSLPATTAHILKVTDVSSFDGGILIRTEGKVEKFSAFKLTKPERLVVDVEGARNGIPSKQVPLKTGGVNAARIGTYADKTRIVFDAANGAFALYKIETSPEGLRVLMSSADAAHSATPAAAPAVAPAVAPAAAPDMVSGLDFKVADGSGRIIIRSGATCNVLPPQRTADGLVLTVRNCSLPKKLQRTLDTSKFGTAVQRVTPYQVKTKGGPETKILVKTAAAPLFELKRDGELSYLDIRSETPEGTLPVPVEAKPTPPIRQSPKPVAKDLPPPQDGGDVQMVAPQGKPAGKKAYTGRRVTLEFADADIRKIFQLLAEVSNQNFLIGDDVTGTISIKLVNVPWDQALDVILESKGLQMKQEGNIVQIKPKGKFKTQYEEDLEARKTQEKLLDLKTQVFNVNFAALSDVATQFKALSSGRPDSSITSDVRTNKVIVTDIEPALAKMKFLLDTLDVPEKQVMIEARIVEASSTFTRDLGIQWGVHYKDGSASILGINNLDMGFGGVVSQAPTSGTFGPGAATGISFGKLTSNIQLDLRLSAAVTAGQVKIISSPKIATINNKAAKISQGQSIPYQNTTSQTGAVTQFVEAALTLEVTPHVTPDGSVQMQVKASNNAPGTGNPPPINKKEATTELLVKDGETTVIGGIYVDSDTDENTGVPFLSNIPLLGGLFKSNTKTKTKTELLIFITPRILG